MSIYDTDWSQFLKKESEVPPDVEFRVMENPDGEDMETGLVLAHRLFLAGVSPVFCKLFFGPMKNTEDVVEIKETNMVAFQNMMNYIYTPPKSKKFSLKAITCPRALCDVLNLAVRYQIDALVNEITLALQNLPITSENMMITAATAKNFGVFEKVSTMLLEKCGKYLNTKLKTPDEVYSFLYKTHNKFPELDKNVLFDVMGSNAKCTNCLQVISACNDGQDVTKGQFRVGLKVARKVKSMNLESLISNIGSSVSPPIPVCSNYGTITDTYQKYTNTTGMPMLVKKTIVVTCIEHNQHTTKIRQNTNGQISPVIVFACHHDPGERIVQPVTKKPKM